MSTRYYRMQNCIQPDLYVNASFTSQQTIGQTYEMALVPPSGIIPDFCWKVAGEANDGISAPILNTYGVNDCSSCTGAPPPTSPGAVYVWAFNEVQGNGSYTIPTSCVNSTKRVYSNVSSFSDLVCGTQHFWQDANLSIPFIGSGQFYNALDSSGPGIAIGSVLVNDFGTLVTKYDCNGFNTCSGPAPSPVPTAPVPSPVPTAPVPSPVPTAPVPAPVPLRADYCLGAINNVTIVGGQYVFNGNYGLYGTGTGIYTFDIPSSDPIAFLNFGKTAQISYDGQFSQGVKTALDGNQYEYFYGQVTVTVTGDYGNISYECYNHGYMGGQNNLLFDTTTCPNLQPPVIPPQGDPELQYTLSYSDSVKGWPSFYSFFPDWMIGMNNYFYTFKAGNLYRHNTNSVRNNFYNVQHNSTLTSVFNQQPLENKLFKTINLESDSAWTVTLDSDIQTGASIDSTYFEKKEGAWFAFIRNNGTLPASADEYVMRSANGIARSSSVSVSGSNTTINFSTNPLIEIGSNISVGDIIYYAPPPYSAIEMAGSVIAINVDLQNAINNIVINNSISGAVAIPIQDGFIMYIKNQEAESNGVLGHYCEFTITNTDSTATELFAVESEVMKSYP